MRKRCDRCRWWESREDSLLGVDWEPMPGNWGDCLRMASIGGSPTAADTRAYGRDYEVYEAYVVSRSDFGCVMFESRTGH